MRAGHIFLLFLFVLFIMPLHQVAAQTLNSEPGYISGEVGFSGFTTTSFSITAVGGGHTVQKAVHDSSAYELAVPGGEWDYSLTASAGLSGGNNKALTVSFSQRKFPVASHASVANDYVFNPGIIRFQVNITGDATLSSAALGSWANKTVSTGEKTATYSSGTQATSARSYSWDLPVVPNQQIELTAVVDVQGASGSKRYTFSKSAAAPYALTPIDVAAGEVVVVPLDISFVDGEPAPPTSSNRGSVAGYLNLLGLPAENFSRHNFNGRTYYDNPAEHAREYTFAATQYSASVGTANTYFDDQLDGAPLRWPFINGQSTNNRVTVYPDNTSYIDLERTGGFLSGTINLRGTVQNEDLKAITFSLSGLGNVYDPISKKSAYDENYYGSALIKRDSVVSNVKRPSERDYRVFLHTGNWEMSSVSLSKQWSAPTRSSTVTFVDHNTRYNGQAYLGTPIHISQGSNTQDFDYCLGSVIIRFWDAQGRQLRNPLVSGNGNHQTDGVTDLTISNINATYSSAEHVASPQVELFGPAGDYRFGTIRVLADDGTTITFPARNLSLSCNTTKILDFPGPVLSIQGPAGEAVTNATALPVFGQVTAGSNISSVTVNGQTAALTPVSGGAAYSHSLPLSAGENIVTVTATEATGAQATDQVIVFADHWEPSLWLSTTPDSSEFVGENSDVFLHVEASDLGYGYELSVYVDGLKIHTANGGADISSPVSLIFEETLRRLSLGQHVVTAIVVDRGGNSVSQSLTINVQEPPPVFYGLQDQLLEATSPEGAIAEYDVTATSTCGSEAAPEVLAAPVLLPQSHAVSTGGPVGRTFSWQAVTSESGDPIEYQVQISDTLSFATILYNSQWQSTTSWSQSLPMGTWYWRVTARNALFPELQSRPATGNSFSILSSSSATVTFPIQNHADITSAGGVYPNPGDKIWVGPFIEDDDSSAVDRSFLMFDTSTLGEGFVVTDARLKLDYQFREYVEMDAVTNVYESTWQLPVTFATFNNLGVLLASQPIAVTRPLGMVSFAIRPDYIDTTGLTRFALAAAVEDFGYPVSAAPGYSRATSYLEITFSPQTMPWAGPVLNPQANVISDSELFETSFTWSEVTAEDGDAVEYLIEISNVVDFSVINFASAWQPQTAWTQTLPEGTWFWRVTARDALHPEIVSHTSFGRFVLTYLPPPPPPGAAVVTCSPESGSMFPLGTTQVSCNAVDACGRSADGSFNISVRDSSAPTLVLPEDVLADAVSVDGAVVTYEVSATDIADTELLVNCHPASGSVFPIGETLVECMAMDAYGNFSTGSFRVVVEQTMPPQLTVPADLTVEATGALTAVEMGQASATHHLDFTLSNDAPELFPLGTTQVTWTAVDVTGNAASAVQTVTVVDTTPPVLQGLTLLALDALSGDGLVADYSVTAEDLVDAEPTVACLPGAGELFPLGETTVTCTATDASGNSVTGSFQVQVRYAVVPELMVPADLTVEATGSLTAVEIGQASVTHLLDVTLSNDAPESFALGTTQVTWTAADVFGNTASAVQTVTVVDTTPPVLQGLSDQVIDAVSADGAVAEYSVTAEDLVDAQPVVACSPASGELFPLGESTVSCTTTDASGNSVTGSFQVQVRDTVAPELTVPADITVLLNTPLSSDIVQEFLNGGWAVDNVDPTVAVTTSVPAPLTSVGTQLVTFTAVDASGNQTVGTAAIRVIYGCGEEFESPVSLNKPFKQKSTVPVKIGFCDANGAAVTSAVVRLALYPVSDDVPAEEPIEIESTNNADTGTYFRVSDDSYIYNLDTKSLSVGSYQVRAILDDGTTRTAPLSLK